jgi:uncharacterized membrane protein HdeD (DUF308 family)
VVHHTSQEANDQQAAALSAPTRGVTGRSTATWRTALVVGLATMVIGIIIVAWPEVTIAVFAVLFGVQLLLFGIFNIVQSIASGHAGGERVLYALMGVLSVIVGVLAMRHMLQTVEVLAVLFGLTWLIGGIIQIVNELSRPAGAGRGWRITLATLTGCAGLVVLAYPTPSLVTLTVLVGVWLIIWGAITAVLAIRARSAPTW